MDSLLHRLRTSKSKILLVSALVWKIDYIIASSVILGLYIKSTSATFSFIVLSVIP